VKAEKKYQVRPRAEDMRMVGEERSWAPGSITDANRKMEMMQGLAWLNYVAVDKDHRRFIEDWIREFRSKTAAQDMDLWNKVHDRHVIPTYCNLARLASRGFPLNNDEHARIWAHILDAAAKSDVIVAVTNTGPKPEPKLGVQERINLQVDEAVIEIEDSVSALLRDAAARVQELNKVPAAAKFSAVHYRRLADALKPMLIELTELREARANRNSDDAAAQQLVEGYSSVTNRALKATLAYLENIVGTAIRLAGEKKVVRLRKKKPVDKAKLVRRFKYLTKNDELKIKSIDPVACLNTSEVWTYDARRRKLAVYRAEFSGSIAIKGSSFAGFAENSSLQKTLRKPDKQLAEFLSLNKNQLRKWFDAIKSTEHRVNGRSNDSLVILRVIE